MVGLFVIWTCFTSPLDIAFDFADGFKRFYDVFDWFVFAIFVADILTNLRCTYFTPNNDEVIDGKMCASAYIKSAMFTFDMLGTLPIAEIASLFQGPDGGGGAVT